MVCSYLNTNNSFYGIKNCMKKYNYNDGTAIGYKTIYNDVYKDSLRNGATCSSGLCRPTNAT